MLPVVNWNIPIESNVIDKKFPRPRSNDSFKSLPACETPPHRLAQTTNRCNRWSMLLIRTVLSRRCLHLFFGYNRIHWTRQHFWCGPTPRESTLSFPSIFFFFFWNKNSIVGKCYKSFDRSTNIISSQKGKNCSLNLAEKERERFKGYLDFCCNMAERVDCFLLLNVIKSHEILMSGISDTNSLCSILS